jgi:apolipoprotein N-acyltransferase
VVIKLALLAGAAVGGVLTGLGFAPFDWWWLTLVGTVVLTALVQISQLVAPAPRGLALTGLVGLGYGLGLAGTTLNWMSAILVAAMVGMVVAVALFYAALALAVRAVMALRAWPLLVPACWVLLEFAISRWPFGGFGWVRVGYAMVDSPLAGAYPLVGVAGATYLAVLSGHLVWWAYGKHDWARLRRLARPSAGAKAVGEGVNAARRLVGWGCLLAVMVAAAGVGRLIAPAPAEGTIEAGWAQGGAPGGGVYGLGEARTITKNETAQTLQLAQDVAAGKLPQPDFVVWPENGTDLDPHADQATAQLVEQAVDAVGVPLFLGAIADGPGVDERQTVSLWWEPGVGETARYAKRAIVPFGEWIPARDILLPLIPQLRYVGAQSVAGDQPGVLPVTLPDGRAVNLGVAVCYDVAFDDVVYDLTRYGGQVIVVQSSNAMYQGTIQIEQQFAMTRVRAAELRRPILVVTTSGISGLIDAFGNVQWRVADRASAHGVAQLGIHTGTTPAVWLAGWLELVIAAAAAAAVGVAGGAWIRRRRG